MSNHTYTPQEDSSIQDAILFLTSNFTKSGHNEKPVVLHSLRVAFCLMGQQQSAQVVIAAILHDLLEDTDVTEVEIGKRFGAEIARLVSALSFKSEIADYTARFRESFERCLAAGPEAVIIKAADLMDNSHYYHLAAPKLQPLLREKLNYFLEISKSTIGTTKIWLDLNATKSRGI